ncbi:MAG: T9SS type A sorting domain-containing protein [Bacteroidetes bacterium]|nr:T9SS type A sorting domain-containing protein [Bacteroidota bacterium]
MMKLFPNPTNGLFTISFPVQQGSGLLQLFDVVGNKVKRKVISPGINTNRLKLPVYPMVFIFAR